MISMGSILNVIAWEQPGKSRSTYDELSHEETDEFILLNHESRSRKQISQVTGTSKFDLITSSVQQPSIFNLAHVCCHKQYN